MYLSPSRKGALEAYDHFISSYQAKHPKATERPQKDKEWVHLLRLSGPTMVAFAYYQPD
jgi:hypothetical protein